MKNRLNKKWKYALMGISATAVVSIPLVSVLSCAEITKNAATNTYYAYSTVSAVANTGNLTDSQINNIVLNAPTDQEIGTSNYANITSITSWKFSDTGLLSSGDVNGTSANLNISKTLSDNNNNIVQQLFTSLLNYVEGPTSLLNYFGQKILEYADSSSGILRRLLGATNLQNWSDSFGWTPSDNVKTVANALLANQKGFENKVNIGSFASNLIHPTQSENMQTTYYLYPTDIFYNVTDAKNFNKNTTLYYQDTKNYDNTQQVTKNSDSNKPKSNTAIKLDATNNKKTKVSLPTQTALKNLLASYMPATPASELDKKPNGDAVKYDHQISVAEVHDIKIVFEFFCSSAQNSHYTTNQPTNATLNQNINGKDGISYPYLDHKSLNYNPYYHKYFVLSINPIYVSLQNIGTTKQSYASLNYYGSNNLIKYNKVEGDKLVSYHPGYSSSYFNYVKYYSSPAASWAFINPTIFKNASSYTVQNLQTAINEQALYFAKIQSISTMTGWKNNANNIVALISDIYYSPNKNN